MSDKTLTIGRYEIQRVLGRGAMGVVYLARDPGLKRFVAIKVVQSSSEDHAITLERFKREAEISARLSHPNIVMVFDVGEDPAAGPFLAMEYVEGASLTELIEKGLPAETSLSLLVQGMSALQAAETAGVVHRDIKPDNILVSRDGRLKLMDFGIARRDESRLTQAGMIFGTPAYTAPELLVGAASSAATDRYAFAVTAFEMLTGQVPYQGDSVASTLYRIVHEPPRFPEGLSPALEQVFRKAFAKAPDARYATLTEFTKALIGAIPVPEELQQRLLSRVEDESRATQAIPSPSPLFAVPTGNGATAETRAAITTHATTARRKRRTLPAPVWPWYRPWMLWTAAGLLAVLAATATSIFLRVPTRAHRMDIASTPAGANVLIDGRYVGKTPLSGLDVRDRGSILRVELPGHQTVTRTIDPGEWSLHLVLVKPPFTIPVETVPSGADVLLNGRAVGATPIESLSVPREGRQELRIRKQGYQEWIAVVDENAPFPSPIVLSPGGYALRVSSQPTGAEVYLDGTLAGNTPMDFLELRGRGPHSLVLKLEGYEPWRGSVVPGKPLPGPIVLKPQR